MDKQNAKVKKQCPDCQKQFINLKLHVNKKHNKVWIICCEKYVNKEEAVLDGSGPCSGSAGNYICKECFT